MCAVPERAPVLRWPAAVVRAVHMMALRQSANNELQVTMPVTAVADGPVGLSLVGPRGSDEALLAVAAALGTALGTTLGLGAALRS